MASLCLNELKLEDNSYVVPSILLPLSIEDRELYDDLINGLGDI